LVYPNPSSDFCTLSFANLNNESHSLVICDIAGKIVKTINNINGYSIELDNTGMESGVYFYKIEAGKFVQTKKMILLK